MNHFANFWVLAQGKNRNKSDHHPAKYFQDVPDAELKRALIDRSLLDFRRYSTFLDTRSAAMVADIQKQIGWTGQEETGGYWSPNNEAGTSWTEGDFASLWSKLQPDAQRILAVVAKQPGNCPMDKMSYGRNTPSVLDTNRSRPTREQEVGFMYFLRRKLPGMLGVGALVAGLMAFGTATAAAAPNATCSGGTFMSPAPILAGTYRSLSVSGNCAVFSGNVIVERNVTILGGGSLNAAFAMGNLAVGRDLLVQPGGLLLLGCEPNTGIPCFDDQSLASNHTIGHNLVAKGAVLVIAHHNTIWGNVTQTGGGGGIPCVSIFQGGPPPYSTYEDNSIHGNVTVANLHTCWSGFFRNEVWGNVSWNDNRTWDGTPEPPGDPAIHGDNDGNEVSDNTVHGNLSCFENFPAAQFGDSAGIVNHVSGRTRGECLALI